MSENIKRDDLSQAPENVNTKYNSYTLAELTRFVDSNLIATKVPVNDTSTVIKIQESREGFKHFLELHTDFQYEGCKVPKCMKVELRSHGGILISYWDPRQEHDMNSAFMGQESCESGAYTRIRDTVLAMIDEHRECLFVNHKILLRMRELSTQSQEDKKKETTNSSNVYITPRDKHEELLVRAVAASIMEEYTIVTMNRRTVYIYKHGVYHKCLGWELNSIVYEHLGSAHNMKLREAVIDHIKESTAMLYSEFESRESRWSPIVNVQNGLLNLLTGELKPHTPKHFSTNQFWYGYNPSKK